MSPVGGKNGARIKRDWTAANRMHRPDGYGNCAVCGKPGAELAHLAGRTYDFDPAIGYEEIPLLRSALFVAPTRVMLLCGPATDPSTCHARQEARRLEIMPYLTRAQETQLVADIGLYAAYHSVTVEED